MRRLPRSDAVRPITELRQFLTRRHFLGRTTTGLGTIALASLLDRELFAQAGSTRQARDGSQAFPNFAPRAKRVIYLFQSGAPSQMDLFDPKPKLAGLAGTELP